ncbi:hypothetical protein, partial [Pseudonocardia spinosispora]|uniref:hypothetical protein n=1 Tax=Pseudonocardia spinosispora TaxID=103441 RepID=UPI0012EC5678
MASPGSVEIPVRNAVVQKPLEPEQGTVPPAPGTLPQPGTPGTGPNSTTPNGTTPGVPPAQLKPGVERDTYNAGDTAYWDTRKGQGSTDRAATPAEEQEAQTAAQKARGEYLVGQFEAKGVHLGPGAVAATADFDGVTASVTRTVGKNGQLVTDGCTGCTPQNTDASGATFKANSNSTLGQVSQGASFDDGRALTSVGANGVVINNNGVLEGTCSTGGCTGTDPTGNGPVQMKVAAPDSVMKVGLRTGDSVNPGVGVYCAQGCTPTEANNRIGTAAIDLGKGGYADLSDTDLNASGPRTGDGQPDKTAIPPGEQHTTTTFAGRTVNIQGPGSATSTADQAIVGCDSCSKFTGEDSHSGLGISGTGDGESTGGGVLGVDAQGRQIANVTQTGKFGTFKAEAHDQTGTVDTHGECTGATCKQGGSIILGRNGERTRADFVQGGEGTEAYDGKRPNAPKPGWLGGLFGSDTALTYHKDDPAGPKPATNTSMSRSVTANGETATGHAEGATSARGSSVVGDAKLGTMSQQFVGPGGSYGRSVDNGRGIHDSVEVAKAGPSGEGSGSAIRPGVGKAEGWNVIPPQASTPIAGTDKGLDAAGRTLAQPKVIGSYWPGYVPAERGRPAQSAADVAAVNLQETQAAHLGASMGALNSPDGQILANAPNSRDSKSGKPFLEAVQGWNDRVQKFNENAPTGPVSPERAAALNAEKDALDQAKPEGYDKYFAAADRVRNSPQNQIAQITGERLQTADAAVTTALTPRLPTDPRISSPGDWLNKHSDEKPSSGSPLFAGALSSGAAAPAYDKYIDNKGAFSSALGGNRDEVAAIRAAQPLPQGWATTYGEGLLRAGHGDQIRTQAELTAATANDKTWDQLKPHLPEGNEPAAVLANLDKFHLTPEEQVKAHAELTAEAQQRDESSKQSPFGASTLGRTAQGFGATLNDGLTRLDQWNTDATRETDRPAVPEEWNSNPAQAAANADRHLGGFIPGAAGAFGQFAYYVGEDAVRGTWSLATQTDHMPDRTTVRPGEDFWSYWTRNEPFGGGMVDGLHKSGANFFTNDVRQDPSKFFEGNPLSHLQNPTHSPEYQKDPGAAMANDFGSALLITGFGKGPITRGASGLKSGLHDGLDAAAGKAGIPTLSQGLNRLGVATPGRTAPTGPLSPTVSDSTKGANAPGNPGVATTEGTGRNANPLVKDPSTPEPGQLGHGGGTRTGDEIITDRDNPAERQISRNDTTDKPAGDKPAGEESPYAEGTNPGPFPENDPMIGTDPATGDRGTTSPHSTEPATGEPVEGQPGTRPAGGEPVEGRPTAGDPVGAGEAPGAPPLAAAQPKPSLFDRLFNRGSKAADEGSRTSVPDSTKGANAPHNPGVAATEGTGRHAD